MSKLLRIDEVATMTGVSASTLRFWRYTGTGPPSARIGKRIFYKSSELEAWIDSKFDEEGGPR